MIDQDNGQDYDWFEGQCSVLSIGDSDSISKNVPASLIKGGPVYRGRNLRLVHNIIYHYFTTMIDLRDNEKDYDWFEGQDYDMRDKDWDK